jgi:ribosome maturation factor RimP
VELNIEQEVERLLAEKFGEPDFESLFLVEVKFNPTINKLEVFVDGDDGITIGECARLNRYLQVPIDENGWLGEKYTLDVSSPGLEKPLKLERQYYSNIGRSLTVTLVDDAEIEGVLEDVLDEGILLSVAIIVLEGKKKVKTTEQRTVAWADIKKAKVAIKF